MIWEQKNGSPQRALAFQHPQILLRKHLTPLLRYDQIPGTVKAARDRKRKGSKVQHKHPPADGSPSMAVIIVMPILYVKVLFDESAALRYDTAITHEEEAA